MPRPTLTFLFLCAAVLACSHPAPATPSQPEPMEHALSGLAAQHVVVLPAYGVRVLPDLDWARSIGRVTDVQRSLDADILAALEERGLRKAWIFPDQLQQSFRRNASYATDPYALAEEPLRAPGVAIDTRLAEPLASQLRTLVALHEDARLILAPVDLRFEKAGAGGRGVLRLLLIDPRTSSVRWVGEISSDTVATFGPAVSASIASRLANAIATP
jgi:hypothetical protein